MVDTVYETLDINSVVYAYMLRLSNIYLKK